VSGAVSRKGLNDLHAAAMWDWGAVGEWRLLVERDLNDPHAAAMWDWGAVG